jgi:NADPH-dependent 2,4-dienoyl-CoA reductase/sulfur reductase-like enzyme/peroxiredoxin family protein/rhodanese-related sulfurtransferase/TusA-related sulfurtransferase
MKVLIVGGVAGGATAAARLRRLDERASIVILERGEHIAYANCGLPYHLGGTIANRRSLFLLTPADFQRRFAVDVRTGHEVVAIRRGEHELEVRDLAAGRSYRETYDRLLLSPGAAPIRPRGMEGSRVFPVRSVVDLDRLQSFLADERPASALVVGGGFLGLEMAENLVARGLAVTLVEMAPQVMLGLDADMVWPLHEHLRAKGVTLELGSAVASLEEAGKAVRATLADGRRLEAGLVVLALGVRPEVELARKAGLEVGPMGGIAVDRQLRTSDPAIFAVGDAIEVEHRVSGRKVLLPLAGPANRQARVAAANIAGRNEEYSGSTGTAIVKVFELAAGFTGLSHQQLERAGIDHRSVIIHSTSHAPYYPGADALTLKLHFSGTGEILGAQAVGREGVDKRIDVIATAIQLGGKVADLARLDLSYAPPFGHARDPVNVAGLMGGNVQAGDVDVVDAADLLARPDRQVVDVSEPAEFAAGHVPGSVNVPLGELRSRLGELDPDQEVVCVCAVGRRSYNACRILQQHGFKRVRNLSGGYRTYRGLARPATPPGDGEVELDACGLGCPGPILEVNRRLRDLPVGATLRVKATDPGFPADIAAWCERTGNRLVALRREGTMFVAVVGKGQAPSDPRQGVAASALLDKTIIVFSGDLDRAIAAFIIATGAAAMGRKVTMFFTFWGLTVLRRKSAGLRKPFLDRMFGAMLARGPSGLKLSRMNLGGIGAPMIRWVMRRKGVMSLEDLIGQAKAAGVRLVACQMSMDVMGIRPEELTEGVEVAGVATYLQASENSGTNLFI